MAAFLADSVRDHGDGTFDVRRGGVTDFMVGGLPGLAHCMMVARIQLDAAEVQDLHHVGLHVMHNGKEIGPWVQWPLASRVVDTSRDSYLNVMVELNLIFAELGDGYIEAVLDSEVRLPHMQFRVAIMSPELRARQNN